MTELSVVICTHNPNLPRLQRVLGALRTQTLPTSRWELLVIDNVSAPPLAEQLDLSWHAAAAIRREENLGLTNARVHGIEASAGPFIVFVDDDNVLAADFLERAAEIAHTWPILGAWGGRIEPEFSETPPEWTKNYWHLLAINLVDAPRWSNSTRTNDALPAGAGLCVRRQVAAEYARRVAVNPLRRRLDRVGPSLSSCGDIDLAMTACELGFGVGQFPALRLTHIMPPERLEFSYLLRLVEGVSYSAHTFAYLRGMRPHDLRISRMRHWIAVYERWRMPARERAFALARERARLRALADLTELERTGGPA
jgi:hypothetical protein